MLARALAELPARSSARLDAARLAHKGVRALGTPRRLAVIVKRLAERQPDLREEVVGPPASAAFAPDGSLTKAGQGFAAKNGVDPGALAEARGAGQEGPVRRRDAPGVGGETARCCPDLLAELAAGIAVAEVDALGLERDRVRAPGAVAGRAVRRRGRAAVSGPARPRAARAAATASSSPGWIEIASADAYVEALRGANVIVDPRGAHD